MLSPSIRQVFHALLTRPPLTYNSLGFVISPFDLHVLGTPPAFILSQDQTLNYSLFNPVRLLALPSFFPFTVLGFVSEISISCGFLHFSFRIFRVALLFSFQCSVLLFSVVLTSNCYNISHNYYLVNNFFHFFTK